jgi:hypothetical protein
MRNLFDQYSQPENRLTHALLACLDEDRSLLRRFLKWVTGSVPTGRVAIYEQGLPGSPAALPEDEVEKRGLPDGCITDEKDWTLLIETKFAAPLTSDQLRRHARTAKRHGLAGIRILTLTAGAPTARLPNGVISRPWTDVYRWLVRQSRKSEWAERCAGYIEVAEERGVASQYLKEGTLTMFSGVPFDADNPYNYLGAKRLLGLLRAEVCADSRMRKLGADIDRAGRSAITGREHRAVWDFIPLKRAKDADVFTQFPHLTLGIKDGSVGAHVTFPNGIKSRMRAGLLGDSEEEFSDRIQLVNRRLRSVVRRTGGTPQAILVQRHYKTQRSKGVEDCLLKFDLRTALPRSDRSRGSVKSQSEWARIAFQALKSRRSNLQFQVGMMFPYTECPVVRSPKLTSLIVETFLACQPLIKAATDRN